MNVKELKHAANEARKNMFEAFYRLGNGHYGGCLSPIEILTWLYFEEMRLDPHNPDWKNRDRMVMSKGHGGYGLYAVLAQRGFLSPERLLEKENGVMLPKHADRHRVPGVDISTGSLGQGLSVAVGMALTAQRFQPDVRVYAVMGDGELNEGQIWEAAASAAHYKLDNLVGIVDKNNLQFDGRAKEILSMAPVSRKWEGFGWHAIDVDDGHSFHELKDAFASARNTKGRPTVIVANTVKGKGISFMENVRAWHGGACNSEQYQQGMQELQGLQELEGEEK